MLCVFNNTKRLLVMIGKNTRTVTFSSGLVSGLIEVDMLSEKPVMNAEQEFLLNV